MQKFTTQITAWHKEFGYAELEAAGQYDYEPAIIYPVDYAQPENWEIEIESVKFIESEDIDSFGIDALEYFSIDYIDDLVLEALRGGEV